jgi:hypothetical protein
MGNGALFQGVKHQMLEAEQPHLNSAADNKAWIYISTKKQNKTNSMV